MVYRAVIRRVALSVAIATAVAVAIPIGAQAATTSPPGASSYKGGNVIVVLKNQHTDLRPGRGSAAKQSPRAKAYQSDQSTVIGSARGDGAKNVRGFTSINAVAATVTPAQEAALATDPSVAAVVPDLKITESPQAESGSATHGAVTAPKTADPTICPSDPAPPLLEPEALQTTNTAFSDASKPQAQRIVNGSGVKVAFIADGLDVNNQDLVRADGTPVIIDHEDFSGEGWDAPASDAEAFGDASAIAAQGLHSYDLSTFVNPAHPLPAGCDITVRGVAPGASLIALKVFGSAPNAPTSRFIEAIDYAVAAGADVLNESFGGNPYPDTSNDPITLADEAAVAAGVTVVTSTGDAGVTGTIGSPASAGDGIIGVGATTMFRSYAQTGYAGIGFSNGKWYDGNISGLSSGGVTSGNTTPDLVAPGDLGWALCSTDTAVHEDCVADNGAPSPIQDFGGTSQSSPLTAGGAALVIAAYRQAHHGASPSPYVVKQILTGTAQDLGHPSSEQGAGQLDTLKAVQAAQSWKGADGPGTPVGAALTVDHTQLSAAGTPGSWVTQRLTVTNTGKAAQRVTASTRALTQTVADVRGSVTLNAASAPAYVDSTGIARSYAKVTFGVGRGVDHLTFLAAGTLPDGFALRTILIDPTGAYTAYSIPQGASNGARSEVRYPVAGTWTAYIAMSASSAFNGSLKWEAIQQRATSIGRVSPSSFTLAPGQSRAVTVTTSQPRSPGDLSASVQLTGSVSGATSVPLSLRAVVPAANYTFSGTLSAGNGRAAPWVGQSQVYYLDVPRGQRDLGVGVTPSDTADTMMATLTAPNGQTYSWTSTAADGTGIQDYVRAPQAGRWMLTLETLDPVSGLVTQSSYRVAVRYNTVRVSAPTLPNRARTTLAQGKAVTVPVTITNTGVAPLTYFADARLNQIGTISLATLGSGENLTLPQPADQTPLWLVPSHVNAFSITGQATQPINVDLYWQGGNPDVYSPAPAGGSTTTTAGITGNSVTPGIWGTDIGQTGPFSGPAPAGSVTVTGTATGQLFDTAVTSPTGDFQSEGVTGQSAAAPLQLAPVLARITAQHHGHWGGKTKAPIVDGPPTLKPGQSATVLVTITPDAAVGTVVSGHLYIDTVDPFTSNSDELIDLPYTYTVG